MKPMKAIFISGAIFFFGIIVQFLPLILTQPYSVQLMGFPVPYAFDHMVETLDGAPPTYSTSLDYILVIADAVFFVAAITTMVLWSRTVLGRNLLIAVMCSIMGLAAYIYLQQTTLWEELSMKDDPCFKAIEGKSPSYVIQRDRVCFIYDSTATDPTSYYKTLPGADPKTFAEKNCGDEWCVDSSE